MIATVRITADAHIISSYSPGGAIVHSPSNTLFGPMQVFCPNGISNTAQLTRVPNAETLTQTTLHV